MNNTRKRKTPFTKDNDISKNKKKHLDKTLYKNAVGSLIYLSKYTIPEIPFTVNKASKKREQPTISDWNKVTNI